MFTVVFKAFYWQIGGTWIQSWKLNMARYIVCIMMYINTNTHSTTGYLQIRSSAQITNWGTRLTRE